jgi:hypothetical protein
MEASLVSTALFAFLMKLGCELLFDQMRTKVWSGKWKVMLGLHLSVVHLNFFIWKENKLLHISKGGIFVLALGVKYCCFLATHPPLLLKVGFAQDLTRQTSWHIGRTVHRSQRVPCQQLHLWCHPTPPLASPLGSALLEVEAVPHLSPVCCCPTLRSFYRWGCH